MITEFLSEETSAKNLSEVIVGQVIGATTLRNFNFVIKKGMEHYVKRDEFVSVEEAVTGNEIIGVVKEITISNELLPDEFGRDLKMANILLLEGEYPVSTVKILGSWNGKSLEMPKYGIKPGSAVKLTSDETLMKILQQDIEKAAFIGTLSSRETVPVYVSINEIVSRHLAILAMTGAGKSYTVGVIIEEIMKKNGAVVVFDLHGEYRDISLPFSKVRIFSFDEESESKLKIDVSSLHASDFSTLIPDITPLQRDLLEEILNLASKFYSSYDLSTILFILNTMYDIKKENGYKSTLSKEIPCYDLLKSMVRNVNISTLSALIRRLRRLEKTGIFCSKGTPIEEIVKRNQLTVIDLSDVNEKISEVILSAICRKIFLARKQYVRSRENGLSSPVLIVIEEAHNFAPRNLEVSINASRGVLRRIAREGRKFGVGLCLVSQRPSKLDADILSQCNSQIILRVVNPSDQEYIKQSVETVTEDIVKDLPSLGRGEAILTGSFINVPISVKIRERETEFGGKDIDVVSEWNSETSG